MAKLLKMLDGIFKKSGSWRPDRSTFFLPGVSQSVNLREFHVLTQFLKMLDGIFKMSGGHFKMPGGRGGAVGGVISAVRACVRASRSCRPDRSTFFLPGGLHFLVSGQILMDLIYPRQEFITQVAKYSICQKMF